MREIKRIQRKRVKGWKTPQNTVYAGRGSKWGNPYDVKHHGLDGALRLFEEHLPTLPIDELLVYDHISCWCPLDQDCHVDLIIEALDELQKEYGDY